MIVYMPVPRLRTSKLPVESVKLSRISSPSAPSSLIFMLCDADPSGIDTRAFKLRLRWPDAPVAIIVTASAMAAHLARSARSGMHIAHSPELICRLLFVMVPHAAEIAKSVSARLLADVSRLNYDRSRKHRLCPPIIAIRAGE